MGITRRTLIRTFLVLSVAVSVAAGAAHATAPAARAECEGGTPYEWAVTHARAAIIGYVMSTTVDAYGFDRVTAVRVERSYGVRPGTAYRGQMTFGSCYTYDTAEVGAHVVILLGVPDPVTPGLTSDHFYTIGRGVTPAQAARVGLDLPDTATGSITPAAPPADARWVPAATVGAAAFLLFLVVPQRRRRGGNAR